MRSWSEWFDNRAAMRREADRRPCGFVMTDDGPVTFKDNPETFMRALLAAQRLDA